MGDGGGVFRLEGVSEKPGKPGKEGGAPTKPARVVKESLGLTGFAADADSEDDDQVGTNEAVSGCWTDPTTGRLGE